MKGQKVLDNNQINWHKGEGARLNYQTIFNEGIEAEAKPEKAEKPEESAKVDLVEALADRDRKWKIKVQKTKEEAWQEGFEEGLKQGREQAEAEIDNKLAIIKAAIDAASTEWKKRQELIDPGLLDLAFEISEAILGAPIEHPEMRKSLELSLGPILERIDNQSKPVLLVAENDFKYIQTLVDEYAHDTLLKVRVDPGINPGEFHFESTEETVIQNVKNTLREFRKELPLPSWTES